MIEVYLTAGVARDRLTVIILLINSSHGTYKHARVEEVQIIGTEGKLSQLSQQLKELMMHGSVCNLPICIYARIYASDVSQVDPFFHLHLVFCEAP